MRRTFQITAVLALLIALFVFAVNTAVAQDVLPDRPVAGRGDQAVQATDEALDQIAETWERDRNPKILLILGVEEDGEVDYNHTSQMSNRIASPLKRHLRSATDRDSVVVPDLRRLREANALDRLRRDAGDSLPQAGVEALTAAFHADLIIDLTFLRSTEPGRYAVNMVVYDTRTSAEVASDSLRTVAPDLTESRGVVMADAMIRSLAREYAPQRRPHASRARTFEFRVLGIAGDDGVGQGALRRITTALEVHGEEVKWAESEFVEMNGDGFAQMRVRYAGRQDGLIDLIERRVLPEFDLAWRVQGTDGTGATVYLFPDDVPDWYAMTNPGAPDFAQQCLRRNASLVASGLPKLGVVVGEDFAEPLESFTGGGEAPQAGFEARALEGYLQDRFVALGFRVVDQTTLRAQLQRTHGNAARYENLPHLLQAMGDLESVDLVLHLNVVPDSNGRQFNARLFHVADAQVIGFQSWPNDAASRFNRYRVDLDDPEEVARYLTGQLIARYDRFAERSLNTLDVRIHNTNDVQDTLALVELIKENVAAVTMATDLQVATPISSFELVYSGQRSDLTLALLDVVGQQMLGAEFQVLGSTLMINLDPVVKQDAPPINPELIPIVGPQDPDDEEIFVPLGPNNDPFRSQLLEARDSVYCVGMQIDENFTPLGTAWQVAPGILATNAHVAMGLHLERARQIRDGAAPATISFVAQRGPAHNPRVTLSPEMQIHPDYLAHQKEWGQYLDDVAQRKGVQRATELSAFVPVAGGDVALLRITRGDSAKPLGLASQNTLENWITPTDSIAYIGFPTENLVRLSNLGAPAQHIDLGHVMAVTDFDALAGTPETRQLIHYDLVTAGGASGSPIFNDRGEVIAVNSAGSYVFFKKGQEDPILRVRTGVAYGQRVDLVHDLLNGAGQVIGYKDFE